MTLDEFQKSLRGICDQYLGAVIEHQRRYEAAVEGLVKKAEAEGEFDSPQLVEIAESEVERMDQLINNEAHEVAQ